MTMMISMSLTGWAADHASPRLIGFVAAMFSASTAFFWGWANLRGRLPEPAGQISQQQEVALEVGVAA